jgi:hypothetical protein
MKYEIDANNLIEKILIIEESFIWSTDSDFREILNLHYLPIQPNVQSNVQSNIQSNVQSNVQSNTYIQRQFQYSYQPYQVRELASKYYLTIIKRMRDFIIKIVINTIINNLSIHINDNLNSLINSCENNSEIITLIVENNSTTKEKQTLKENIIKLESVLKIANKIDVNIFN